MNSTILLAVAVIAGVGSQAHAGSPGLEGQIRRFADEIGQPALLKSLPPKPELEIPSFREVILSHDPAPGVRDADLDQTLRNIGMLRDSHDRNEAIERCFRANQGRLAPYQVEKLLRAVSPTDYDSYHNHDRYNSIKRIVAEYLGTRASELPASVVVSLAHRNVDDHEVNERLEEFFNSERSRLVWNEVEALLRGLRTTDYDSYHTYDRNNSIKRISEQFLRSKATDTPPQLAVTVAHWNSDPHRVNEMLERYFRAVKGRIGQHDVETLLSGIRATDYDSYHTYDRESTKERIVKAWGCPLCPLN